MQATVISSRVFSHPLNPASRMDAAYCAFLHRLDKGEIGREILEAFLRSKGLEWDTTETLVPWPVVSYLEQALRAPYEEWLGALHLTSKAAATHKLPELDKATQEALRALHSQLVDLLDRHYQWQQTQVEKKRQALRKHIAILPALKDGGFRA